jgi:colicin import membrane protein
MEIAKDIKDRITAAADALYDEARRAEFPTVASVRARAGVDMNAASIVMREWRRAQTAHAAPPAADVPERVRAISSAALATLWAEAQSLANASLSLAQAEWDRERAAAETLREELSAAFDVKAAELHAALAQVSELKFGAEEAERRHRELTAALASACERAATAEARTIEIERRASDLGSELARVHAEAKAERERLTAEVAQAQIGLKGERDAALESAAQAREGAARLRGKLEALESLHINVAGRPIAGQGRKGVGKPT